MPPFQSWEQPRLIVPIYFFFIAAPVEELGKLAALLATLWLFSLHRRPLALLGCGLAVGVGFACLENYRFGLQHGFEEALSRIGGFLLHAVLTGIAAIFIAFGFIMPQRRWRYWLSAICIPITFHGAHNFLLIARKWIGEFDPSDPVLDALAAPVMGLFAFVIDCIAIGMLITLFVQLRRTVASYQTIEPRAWKAGDRLGLVLVTFGIFGVTGGLNVMLAALSYPPIMGPLENLAIMAIGALIVLGSFLILKRGWKRVS